MQNKKQKIIIASFIVAVFLVLMIVSIVLATNSADKKITFHTNGTYDYQKQGNKITILEYKSENQNQKIEIPSAIDGVKVVAIGDGAFINSIFNEVVFPETVTKIGVGIFKGQSLINKVIFKGVLDTIEAEAFANCYNLEYVELQNGLQKINDRAFFNCSKLQNFVLPVSVNSIGQEAFAECNELTNINLREVTQVAEKAFYDCNRLETVKLNAKTTSIGAGAFENCAISSLNFEDLTILNSIGARAFYNAFSYTFKNVEGVSKIALNEGLTAIGDYAFALLDVSIIQLPESLTSLGIGCFAEVNDSYYSGSYLKQINIPSKITKLPDYTFFKCSSLTDFKLPNTVTELGKAVFVGCSNLKDIAFENSDKFKIFNENYLVEVATKRLNSFLTNSSSNITIKGNIGFDTICEDAFYYAQPTEIILEEGIKFVQKNAFRKCRVAKITFRDSACVVEDDLSTVSVPIKDSVVPKLVIHAKLNSKVYVKFINDTRIKFEIIE
ncbi:MAG: leucine-rich repeat domain-containing protein [Clostridia bacterium]